MLVQRVSTADSRLRQQSDGPDMSTFTGHHQLPIRYNARQMSQFRRGKWVALICAVLMIALSITSILVRHFS